MTNDIKCPICGSKTTLRIAKKGPDAGKKFNVCTRYPECKGKVAIVEIHVHGEGKDTVSTKTTKNKKPILHDGYYVKNGEVTFFNDSVGYKTACGKHPKVDQNKVMLWEGFCDTYRKGFMAIGWLRLHTPVYPHQEVQKIDPAKPLVVMMHKPDEHLGTHFLSVPPQHRDRIADMLKGGTLVTHNELKTFRVFETGEELTFQQLIGDGEFFDFLGTSAQNHKDFEIGKITKEEYENRLQTISQWEKTKFYLLYMKVDMFVEE